MKIVLNETVENLGTVGDVVAVRDGYARNYLLPRGIAVLADPRNVKTILHRQKMLEKKRLREVAKAEELAAALGGTRLGFRRRASEQNQLFGSVTPADVEGALTEKGFSLSRKQIVLEHPIKALGEFPVTMKLHGGVRAEITVVVERETTEA